MAGVLDLRIGVGHAIAGIKRVRIVLDTLRCWRKGLVDEVMLAASGLHKHADLMYSRFGPDILNFLKPELPDLKWWDNSDPCLRLRFGVVKAYISENLDPHSFRH